MATIPYEIPLYIDHPQQAIKFRLQQNDVNSLQIIITIYEDNEEFIIPTGYPVYLRMLKPDNKVVYNECSVENNKAIFSVTAQMTAMHGRASAQLEIIDPVSGGNVKTIQFHALIDEEVISDSQIESSNEFTALQSMAIYIADFSTRVAQIGDLTKLETTSNTDLVGAVNEVNTNKLDKTSLAQADTINDPEKPVSSVVTYTHGLEIDTLALRNSFVYGSASGIDANTLVGSEKHVFLINSINVPFSHGFIDAMFFNGANFAPSGAGAEAITIQIFRHYDNGQTYTRSYNHRTQKFTEWNNWLVSSVTLDPTITGTILSADVNMIKYNSYITKMFLKILYTNVFSLTANTSVQIGTTPIAPMGIIRFPVDLESASARIGVAFIELSPNGSVQLISNVDISGIRWVIGGGVY